MEDSISFIIFAGLFYLMMRHGCGSHMIHGKHQSQNKQDPQKDTDPVCGMSIDFDKGYGKMYKDNLYRFCSRNCLDQFEAEPGKYVKPPIAKRDIK